MKTFFPPRHIVWSTDSLDLDDPFQRKWFTEQVLLHGRTEDLQYVNFAEVAEWLDDFNLPSEMRDLWRAFLERKFYERIL